MEQVEKEVVNNSNTVETEKLSKKNVVIFAIGFLALILGYFVLTYTDSRGQNSASIISPILLVGAYITMGLAMIIK